MTEQWAVPGGLWTFALLDPVALREREEQGDRGSTSTTATAKTISTPVRSRWLRRLGR